MRTRAPLGGCCKLVSIRNRARLAQRGSVSGLDALPPGARRSQRGAAGLQALPRVADALPRHTAQRQDASPLSQRARGSLRASWGRVHIGPGHLMRTAIDETDIASTYSADAARPVSLSEGPGSDEPILSLSQLRETVCRIMTLLAGATKALDEKMVDPVRDSIEQAALILLQEIGHPLKIAHLVSGHRTARRCELLSWQARQVFEFVEQHLAEPLRVSDLSALINLSEGHFSRAFKRRFGIPPHTYLLHRRIQHSARLM